MVVTGGGPPFRLPGLTPSATPVSASVEIYDPAADRWADAGPLTHARAAHTAVVLDGPSCRKGGNVAWCGRVLVMGGVVHGDDPSFAQLPVRIREALDTTYVKGLPLTAVELGPCLTDACRPVADAESGRNWPVVVLVATAAAGLATLAIAAWLARTRRRRQSPTT